MGSKIVGTQTFERGQVQELNTLSSTEQYKITTKKWLTPKGHSIDKVGIKPDFEIELTAEYYETFEDSKDTQLQKALSLFLET